MIFLIGCIFVFISNRMLPFVVRPKQPVSFLIFGSLYRTCYRRFQHSFRNLGHRSFPLRLESQIKNGANFTFHIFKVSLLQLARFFSDFDATSRRTKKKNKRLLSCSKTQLYLVHGGRTAFGREMSLDPFSSLSVTLTL